MTDFAIPGLMPLGAPKYEAHPPSDPLEPHCAANSLWVGIAEIGPVTYNDESMPYPAASARLEFTPRFHENDDPIILSSENPEELLILDEASWYFSAPPQPLTLLPGMWDWRFLVVDTQDPAITTLVSSGTILIQP